MWAVGDFENLSETSRVSVRRFSIEECTPLDGSRSTFSLLLGGYVLQERENFLLPLWAQIWQCWVSCVVRQFLGKIWEWNVGIRCNLQRKNGCLLEWFVFTANTCLVFFSPQMKERFAIKTINWISVKLEFGFLVSSLCLITIKEVERDENYNWALNLSVFSFFHLQNSIHLYTYPLTHCLSHLDCDFCKVRTFPNVINRYF